MKMKPGTIAKLYMRGMKPFRLVIFLDEKRVFILKDYDTKYFNGKLGKHTFSPKWGDEILCK